MSRLKEKLPLKNCMIDLTNYSLTVADPEDFVLYTAGWDWPTDPKTGLYEMPTEADIKWVLSFFASITGDEEQFRYLLTMKASDIEGENRFNMFCFLCGQGGNGKGLMMNLMGQLLGDLMQQIPVGFWQDKRDRDPNAPSPMLMALQHARVVNSS